MNLSKMKLGVFILLIFGAFVASSAQTSNGTIAGTVSDATGAAIVGATVTATSIQTNIGRTAATNSAGGYRLDSMQPGTYKISVSAPSFAETTIDHVEVTASVITSANASLSVGPSNTVIEVGAVTEGLRTDSGELSDTISFQEVNNLPISDLNPYSLATTLPGVTTVTADDETEGTSFSVNGNRPRSNNFLIEGADNNDQGLHGQAFQPQNVEAIQEITFLLSSFSSEFGAGGSVSNVILQSGTNQFHGAIFERLLNSALDATDHSTVLNLQAGATNGKSKSRENFFGFRVGGPILHDRAFFFVSNQWDRLRSTANAGILQLPTAAGYAVLKQYASNPRIATLLKAYGGLIGTNAAHAESIDLGDDPLTGDPRGTVDFAGYQRSLSSDEDARELDATVDMKISDPDKVRFRFIQSPLTIPNDNTNFPTQLPGFDTYQFGSSYNAGITETHVFSSHVLNELRLSWSRIGFNFALPAATLANPLALMPSVSIDNIQGYGIPAGSVPQGRTQNTYQLQDAISLNYGRHSFKFGFDVSDGRIKDAIPWNYYGSIPYQDQTALGGYTGLANYLDDFSGYGGNGPGTGEAANISFGNPIARPTIWGQSYYAQDNWKVTPNLELDFGLRYEYYGTPFNQLGYPAINLNNPAAFQANVPQTGDKNDFGPRFGFNFQPFSNGKTAISGGVGVFYSHIFTNIIDNIQGSSPNSGIKDIYGGSGANDDPDRGTAHWSTAALAVCPTCLTTSTAPQPSDFANIISSHLLDPITYEYNLRVQHELPGHFVASAEFVGNRTEKNYSTEEFNPFLPTGQRYYPGRGRMVLEDNQGDSNYNGGQFEIEHKTGHGLALRAVYTYSKMFDDTSEIFTDSDSSGSQISTYAEIQRAPRNREVALSAFDHRNRIVGTAVYTPPIWHAEGAARILSKITNGFTFSTISSFQSGQPENVEIGFDWNGDGISNDRPILLNKNAPITNWAVKGDDPFFGFGMPAGTLCDGPEFWATTDPCKVVNPSTVHWVTSYFQTTQNTVSRNFLTTAHISNTDLSVQRSFKTFEKQSFDFRVEALNVFNQGNTGSYNATLITGVPFNGTDVDGNVYTGATTFGNKYLTTAGQRILRIFVRYQF